MSVDFDKMRMVRVWPRNVERLQGIQRDMAFPTGLTALVNACIEHAWPTLKARVLKKPTKKTK